VFMDVKFINKQGVLYTMYHHTDLQQNKTQKLNFCIISTLHYQKRLPPSSLTGTVTMELIQTWKKQ
jgi:hypothetical protein